MNVIKYLKNKYTDLKTKYAEQKQKKAELEKNKNDELNRQKLEETKIIELNTMIENKDYTKILDELQQANDITYIDVDLLEKLLATFCNDNVQLQTIYE